MRRVPRFAVLFLASLAASLGCGTAAPAATDQTLELRNGEKASVSGGELTVTFVGVPEDSRCPKGEQCIQAGRARLSFEGVVRGGAPVRFELDSSREAETQVGQYWITLEGLQPFPVAGRRIAPQDYVARLQIRRSPT